MDIEHALNIYTYNLNTLDWLWDQQSRHWRNLSEDERRSWLGLSSVTLQILDKQIWSADFRKESRDEQVYVEIQDELLQQKDALLKDIRVIQKRKIKEMEELYEIKLKKKSFEQELEDTKLQIKRMDEQFEILRKKKAELSSSCSQETAAGKESVRCVICYTRTSKYHSNFLKTLSRHSPGWPHLPQWEWRVRQRPRRHERPGQAGSDGQWRGVCCDGNQAQPTAAMWRPGTDRLEKYQTIRQHSPHSPA